MPKIVTFTLNPALDIHQQVETPKLGALNRANASHYSASGKGLNVSKALSRLGVASTAIMPLGGLFGSTTQSLMGRAAAFYTPDVVPIRGETRCNFKINDAKTGKLTEFNDLSPTLSQAELETCQTKLVSSASANDVVVLSGSLPGGADASTYAQIIEKLRLKKVWVALDTSGDALAEGIKAEPDLVKPNRLEAETLLDKKIKTYGDAVTAAEDIQKLGAGEAIISLGAAGAVFIGSKTKLIATHPKIKPISTNGCGDALLGAYIHGILEDWDDKQRAQFALATATMRALMERPRFPDPKLINAKLDGVTVHEAADFDLSKKL